MNSELARLRSENAALRQLLEVHELTALQQASKAEHVRRRLLDFIDQAPAIISIITGPDWILEYANPPFFQLISKKDIVGKPVREVFPEIEGQGLFEVIEEVMTTGQPFTSDETSVWFDRSGEGTMVEGFFNQTYQPLRDENGDVYGILSHSVEVTEQVLARRRVEAMAAELRGLSLASLALSVIREPQAILEVAATQARELVLARRCLITLLPVGEEAPIQVASTAARSDWEPEQIALDIAVETAQRTMPLLLNAEDVAERYHGEKAPRSVLGVPLLNPNGEPMGALVLFDRIDGQFSESDEVVMQQLTFITAASLVSARAYEQEHRIAETLQRSLLPERIPKIPGINVDARYLPAGALSDVGGDWYDVLPLEDGRFVVTLGDVVGRGVRAASVMGQLRMAIRSYAMDGHGPAAVLDRADRLLQVTDPGQMATAIHAVFDPMKRTLRIASAGHPPPVLLSAQGEPSFAPSQPSVPMGVVAHARHSESELTLEPGSTFLLYTDGLIEARGEGIEEGMERLLSVLRSAPQGLAELLDHVVGQLLPNGPVDDVAMLGMRPISLLSEPLRLKVPAEPRSVALVRHTINWCLQEAGATEEDVFNVTLAVSEACANAIEHAYGPADGSVVVDVMVEEDTVTVVVHDKGQWRPPRGAGRGRGLQLIEMAMDDVQIDRTEGGTDVTMRKRLTMEPSPIDRVES